MATDGAVGFLGVNRLESPPASVQVSSSDMNGAAEDFTAFADVFMGSMFEVEE